MAKAKKLGSVGRDFFLFYFIFLRPMPLNEPTQLCTLLRYLSHISAFRRRTPNEPVFCQLAKRRLTASGGRWRIVMNWPRISKLCPFCGCFYQCANIWQHLNGFSANSAQFIVFLCFFFFFFEADQIHGRCQAHSAATWRCKAYSGESAKNQICQWFVGEMR